MTINKRRFKAEHFHPQRDPKTRIVLHFTAGGTVGGAVSWWNSEYQRRRGRGQNFYVGTPFLVERDPVPVIYDVGTPFLVERDPAPVIYEIFPRQAWAYGLGINNAAVERTSVQIEIVNYGFLRQTENGFVPAANRAIRIPDHEVIEQPYRGERYWQTFPDAQVLAVAHLCRELCDEFEIPRVVPPKDKRGVCDQPWAIGYRGIVDHTNFIKIGKWDMGPAWPWDRFQQLLEEKG